MRVGVAVGVLSWVALTGACSSPSTGDSGAIDAADSAATDAADVPIDTGPIVPGLTVAGDPGSRFGIFDPSVVYPPGAATGYLAYSVVTPDRNHVSTRIAQSTDHGATWQYVADVNTDTATTVMTSDHAVCGQASCSGWFIHEVPSLLVDPTDTPDRMFKVFTHSYFNDSAGSLRRELGNLSLWTAASASGPWTQSPLLGWNSSATVSSAGVAQNIDTDASLAGVSHCLLLTEPGALLRGSGSSAIIDLAVDCVSIDAGQPVIDIHLLRSTDHARSFTYVSNLVSVADGTTLGAAQRQISAPDLFQVGSETYLFVTPDGVVNYPTGPSDGYRGCIGLHVTDLTAGQIARNAGAPLVVSSYLGSEGQFTGACTAAEGATALGVAGGVLDFTMSTPFNIFATHGSLP